MQGTFAHRSYILPNSLGIGHKYIIAQYISYIKNIEDIKSFKKRIEWANDRPKPATIITIEFKIFCIGGNSDGIIF